VDKEIFTLLRIKSVIGEEIRKNNILHYSERFRGPGTPQPGRQHRGQQPLQGFVGSEPDNG